MWLSDPIPNHFWSPEPLRHRHTQSWYYPLLPVSIHSTFQCFVCNLFKTCLALNPEYIYKTRKTSKAGILSWYCLEMCVHQPHHDKILFHFFYTMPLFFFFLSFQWLGLQLLKSLLVWLVVCIHLIKSICVLWLCKATMGPLRLN